MVETSGDSGYDSACHGTGFRSFPGDHGNSDDGSVGDDNSGPPNGNPGFLTWEVDAFRDRREPGDGQSHWNHVGMSLPSEWKAGRLVYHGL